MAARIWAWIEAALVTAGAGIGWYVGGMDGLMVALVVLMVLDYVTGIMVAIMNRELSSSVGFKGICKKILICALVGVANVIDITVIKEGAALRTATLFFYIANEGVSVIENAGKIGLPVPEKLKKVLAQLHDKSDADGE